MGPPTPQPCTRIHVDNIPACQSRADNDGKRGVQLEEESFPSDITRKKGRLWVFTAQILATPASDSNPLCLLMWTMSC